MIHPPRNPGVCPTEIETGACMQMGTMMMNADDGKATDGTGQESCASGEDDDDADDDKATDGTERESCASGEDDDERG